MTPELIGYAKAIVAERNISQSEMTPAVMGEVLTEAVRRMDTLVTEVIEGRTERASGLVKKMAGQIYIEIVAREVAA